ncbi:MAG: hypothetical protein ABJB12_20000 [Pseudomonadota bacterium]
MHFGSVWLLAFICLVVGGCAVAAMPAPQTLLPRGPAPLQRTPNVDNDAARLGPPSPRGVGRRRVDSAVNSNTPRARD